MSTLSNECDTSFGQETRPTNLDNGNRCLRQQNRNDIYTSTSMGRYDENEETTPLISNSWSLDGNQRNSQRGPEHQTTAKTSWYKKPSVYWLLPAFFPYCVAYGSIIVPQTYLIQNLVCRRVLAHQPVQGRLDIFNPSNGRDPGTFCDDDDKVQADTAMFCLWTDLVSGILTAIVTPHLGALSDRIGRKPVMICSTLGAFIGGVTTIVVGRNSYTISMNWLLLGFVADGLCGSLTSIMVLCNAYTSDCTTPRARTVAFGHFQAAIFAGVALGPIIGGAIIQKTDDILAPFYFALSCHLFFILFTYLAVPESLSKKKKSVDDVRSEPESSIRRRGLKVRDLNIFAPLSILWPKGSGPSTLLRRNLVVLAMIDTMTFGIALSTLQILLLFARKRFHWSPVEATGFLSAVNTCKVTVLILLPLLLARYFQGTVPAESNNKHVGSDSLDLGIIRFSVLLETLGYMGYAFAPSGSLFTLSGVIACFGSLESPTLQASLTKAVPAERTGRMLGALGSLHALARVVMPVVVNVIYGNTVAWFAGFVFLCFGSLLILGFTLSWLLRPGLYLDDGVEQNPSTSSD